MQVFQCVVSSWKPVRFYVKQAYKKCSFIILWQWKNNNYDYSDNRKLAGNLECTS